MAKARVAGREFGCNHVSIRAPSSWMRGGSIAYGLGGRRID